MSHLVQTTGLDNFNWAQQLAGERLSASASDQPQPQAQPGQALDPEIWDIVARLLAGENDLTAIGHLNVCCSDIHHATLPTLYESVYFRSSEELERAIALNSTNRWKHVK